MFPFCGYQLDGKLFWILLFPGKVYADVINGLQYCVAKMHLTPGNWHLVPGTWNMEPGTSCCTCSGAGTVASYSAGTGTGSVSAGVAGIQRALLFSPITLLQPFRTFEVKTVGALAAL